MLKLLLTSLYKIFTTLFFDVRQIFNKWRGIPYFFKSLREYNKKNKNINLFKVKYGQLHPVLHERYEDAGSAQGHYFFQDIWAAQYLHDNRISEVVDVGSRIDGYIAHLLSSIKVTYIDIRSIKSFHQNFIYKEGSILDLPFKNNSVKAISCLHVIEHIGLGRYGDKVDPYGHVKGIEELKRICAEDGKIIFGTPVGNERVNFNAHRVFNPETIINLFKPLKLEEFSLIDDKGLEIIKNPSIEQALGCNYGCGLFVFSKNER
jgi:SAM-dependent methyltransferase